MRRRVVVSAWLSVVAAMLMAIALAAPATGVAAVEPPAPDCVRAEQLGLVVVIDDSGSMQWNDPDDLRTEASVVALSQQTNGGVFAFSTFATEARGVVAPTALTNVNRAGMAAAIRGRNVDFMGTDYESAFVEAKRQLDAMPLSVDKKAVIFLSDGEPNDTYTSDAAIVAAHVPIYTIGFGGVDLSELAGIAARSGGQTFPVASADELQPVMAKILAVLECNAQNIVQEVPLAPGETKSIPFTVAPTELEFKALAAWSDGEVTASLTRPDGSTMDAAHLLASERWDSGATFASGVGNDPQRGNWAFNLTASPANLASLNVTINVWGGDPAMQPDPEPEPEPEPTPPPAPPVVTPQPPHDPEPVKEQPAPGNCVAVALSQGAQTGVRVTWDAPVVRFPAVAHYVVETRARGSEGAWARQPFAQHLKATIGASAGSSFDVSVQAQFADGTLSARCIVQSVAVPLIRTLTGTQLVDQFIGSDGKDRLDGKAGNDVLTAGGGDDVLFGGSGNDTLKGELGNDQADGGIGRDFIDGGAGNDKLNGGEGIDVIKGGSGNDVINVVDGSTDLVQCGSGKDKVTASKRDRIAVDCEIVIRR